MSQSLRIYGNVSTSFDPPATVELANPYGPTGFNPDIDSQSATNYEVGMKGRIGSRLRYDLAAFHIDVRDEIVPFELEGSGQSFYRNAGRSTHDGLEAMMVVEIASGMTASAAYTWSDFTFDEFNEGRTAVFNGNRIPGIPEHLLNIAVDWTLPSDFYLGWDLLYAGHFFADNANRVETGYYLVSNIRGGFRWQAGAWRIEPFAGVSNLFDERYMANIRLNAAFGRYYEPAPERNVYGGVLLSYTFD